MSAKTSLQEALARKQRIGRLTERLPPEEREELAAPPIIVATSKTAPPARVPARMAKPKQPERKSSSGETRGKPIGVMVYLGEKEYEQLEEMLYRGKRFCRKATGLSFYYQEFYQQGDSFREDVIALVETRRRTTQGPGEKS
jgi:hypothetical protein